MKTFFFVVLAACQMPHIVRKASAIDGEAGTAGAGPVIASVTGNSPRQPGRIDTGIIISGERLDAAAVRLLDSAGSAFAELTVTRAEAASVEALLPMSLAVGDYTLEVTNDAGVARQAVQILRGEQGPAGPTGAPGRDGLNGSNGMNGANGATGAGGSGSFGGRIQVGGTSGIGQGNVHIANQSTDYARITMRAGGAWNLWDIAAGGQAIDGDTTTSDFNIYHADQDGHDYNVLSMRGDGAMTVRGAIRSVGGNPFNGGANGYVPIAHADYNRTCTTVCANHGYFCGFGGFRLNGASYFFCSTASTSSDPPDQVICFCSSN